MNIKYSLLTALIIGLVGYAIGRYMQPAEVITKQVEVVKEIEVVKRDVKTVIKEVVRPDGSKETVTTIDENTRERTRRESDVKTEVVQSPAKPQWEAGVMVKASLNNIIPVYGIQVERRILGPFSVGVQGWSDTTAGVSLNIEF